MQSRFRALGIVIAGILGGALALGAPAFGCTEWAQVRLGTSSGPPGAAVLVTLYNFHPVSDTVLPVEIHVAPVGASTLEGPPVATVSTTTAYDKEGNEIRTSRGEVTAAQVAERFTVPQVAPGIYVVHARQLRASDSAVIGAHSATFQVTRAPAPPAEPTDGPEQPAPGQQAPEQQAADQQQQQQQQGDVAAPTTRPTVPPGRTGQSTGAVQSEGAAAPAVADQGPSVAGTPAADATGTVVGDEAVPSADPLLPAPQEELWSGLSSGGTSMLEPTGGSSGSTASALGAVLLTAGLLAVAGAGAALAGRRLAQVRSRR